MYDSYFGLREAPFSIAPDPRYLYLSAGHREALAHLLYGIGEGGGFVQLTGEVGTGKTTVCRALLEQLPPGVDVAMVFNPGLTALELLATVCDELRAPYPAGTTSLKVLVDALYQYLLDAHGRSRRTVLIIDEAQNLSREVLEQVRLLTNLETTREKLLQIILIGQPELAQLLARPDLRQLAQRVTARYHLLPFTARETRAYVEHRLHVAGQRRPIFERGALRAVHRYSGGVPRLVNTICDRALLGAFATGRSQVTPAIVRRAAGELLGRRVLSSRWRRAPVAAAVLVALAAVGAVIATGPLARIADRAAPPASPPAVASPVVATVAATRETPEPSASLTGALGEAPAVDDKARAFATLFAHWDVEFTGKPGELACAHARRVGLRCLSRTGTLKVARRLDLPAVLALPSASGEMRYAVLAALGDDTATLQLGDLRLTVPQGELERVWDGAFTVLWKPPAAIGGAIEPGMRFPAVVWLRQRLAEVDGGSSASPTPELYDDSLRRRVIAFQRAQQLPADGIVGEETLVRLAATGSDWRGPSLSTRAR